MFGALGNYITEERGWACLLAGFVSGAAAEGRTLALECGARVLMGGLAREASSSFEGDHPPCSMQVPAAGHACSG